VRVHDLKHTFGRRLRAAGVSFEDRQDLLGHKSGRITTHYSQAELESLIDAAERVRWLTPSSHSNGILARPERFELPTSWFVERCSESHKSLRRLRNGPLECLNISAAQW
jgi:hypothetical protein